MSNLIKPVIVLTIISFVAAGALALTYSVTNPKIIQLETQKQNDGLKAIFKEASSFKSEKKGSDEYFIAKNSSGKEIGHAFLVKSNGYSSDGIQMLVGINSDGIVEGVQIISQLETPGLGTNITKSWFLDQFKGKKASDPIKAKKDIDAITGATISSKAVANGVRQAFEIESKVGAK